MQNDQAPKRQLTHQILLFVAFLVSGSAIFVFGNNWTSLFPTNRSALYKWGLACVFLVLALVLRERARFQAYWKIAFALFVAASANALMWSLGDWLADLLPPPVSAAHEIAIDKVSQCVPVVLAIGLLTKLVGDDLGSIYIKKGNLKWGLRFGLISFAVFAVLFGVIAVLQAGAPSSVGLMASGIPLGELVAAIPWILVFVFANSLMEELWFRGIFLRRLTPYLGAAATVVVTSLVFGLAHLGATYVAPLERVIFGAVVFVLGLVNGAVMLKTDSIWGSLLFHAGYDLLIIIPVLVSEA